MGVTEARRPCAVSVLGGPTIVLDLGGQRIVVDPTFDPPGPHAYLTKTAAPAVDAAALGRVDVVLVSHDQHLDNFDDAGRAMALAAPLVLTNPGAAQRLGSPARGLAPWETAELDGLRIQAVPAVHGPADGERDDSGHVNCEVTGFVLSGEAVPTVYVSGDNASLAAVAEIANGVGAIDVAVLFVGAARVPPKQGGRPLTLTSARAAAAAEVLAPRVVVAAHLDSWAHFTEGVDDVAAAFHDAGIGDLLDRTPHGSWLDLEPFVAT
ncbi:MBL fold metallo-hydrolase [Mycobacterium yunnanensis]|uniref:MBL fold metallo-hydrolase n=1 Tax=Mycobacterium yunnanensis TaxID=368477 RepID=A0A9X2Z2L2_9MYCO|nr:MBL fold metallo-hydrolase [Mycobacterium yunnanensis]MCV7420917.1 MBL fold metallo-hydrolase [Mycobacterium yunnanensis]